MSRLIALPGRLFRATVCTLIGLIFGPPRPEDETIYQCKKELFLR